MICTIMKHAKMNQASKIMKALMAVVNVWMLQWSIMLECSNMVQIWFRYGLNIVPILFQYGSNMVPIWSNMVPRWFQYGSNVVQYGPIWCPMLKSPNSVQKTEVETMRQNWHICSYLLFLKVSPHFVSANLKANDRRLKWQIFNKSENFFLS